MKMIKSAPIPAEQFFSEVFKFELSVKNLAKTSTGSAPMVLAPLPETVDDR
jgi:hypothetical protein